MSRLLICIFFIFHSVCAFSQNIKVNIQARDSIGKPIEGAGIQVVHKTDGSVIQYGFTDKQGSYVAEVQKQQLPLMVWVNALGYATDSISITQKNIDKTLHLITLNPKPFNLDEVIVRPKKVIVQNDTIRFNADSFRKLTDRSLEDLLVRLPGISVSEDGRIRFKGKPISTILIEGDQLTGNDYRVLSKNLSADMVEEVQAIDNYNENPIIGKFLKNSGSQILNIDLDEKRKKWLFGDLTPGVGMKNRFKGNANLLSLQDVVKFYGILNANNTGQSLTPGSTIHFNAKGFAGNFLQFTPNLSKNQMASPPSYQVPYLQSERSTLNTSGKGEANLVFDTGKKLSTDLNIGYSLENIEQTVLNQTRYSPANEDGFTTIENSGLNRDVDDLHGELSLKYSHSKKTFVKFSSRFDRSTGKNNNQLLFNGSNRAIMLDGDKQQLESQLEVTHKLNNAHLLKINAAFISNRPEQQFAMSTVNDSILPGTNNIWQNSNSKANLRGLKAGYVWKIGKANFYASLESTRQKERIHNAIRPFSASDSIWSATFTRSVQQMDVGISFRAGKIGSFALSVSPQYHKIAVSSNIVDTNLQKKPKDIFYIQPKLSFSRRLSKNIVTGITYVYRKRSIENSGLYPGPMITDYRTISTGTPQVDFWGSHSVSASIDYSDWDNFIIGSIKGIYTRSLAQQISNLTLNSVWTKRYTRTLNMPSNNYFMFFTLTTLLGPINSTLKLESQNIWSTYFNKVNTSGLRKNQSFSQTHTLHLISAFQSLFNFKLRSRYVNNSYRNKSLNIKNRMSYLNNWLSTEFEFSKQWQATFTADHYYFGQVSTEKKHTLFIDAGLQYTTPNKNVTFYFTLKNLLNNRNLRLVSSSDYYRSELRYELLPMYGLLEVKFRF